MSLLSLPNELLLLIAEMLPMKDVNSLHLTNHHLACLTTTILHRFAVQERSSYGMVFPPLHWAAWKGHVSLTRLLLDKQFEIDAKTRERGKTALQCAAWQGHEAVVRLLLDRGAAIDERDNKYGKSALHQAALRGYEKIVKLLLQRGADVGVKDHTGQTALFWVARSQSRNEPLVDILGLLLEAGAHRNIDDQEFEKGETALHWAVWKGHWKTVKLFLEWGASIEVPGNDGETALDWALKKRNSEMVNLLLGKLGVSNPGNDGETALAWALKKKRNSEMTNLLLEGPRVSDPGNDGKTALDRALKKRNSEMVNLPLGGLRVSEGAKGFSNVFAGEGIVGEDVTDEQERGKRWGRRFRSLSKVMTGKIPLLKQRKLVREHYMSSAWTDMGLGRSSSASVF